MKQSIVLTLIGRDRPGLVDTLAAVVEQHGGNWEESRMVQLAGAFAGLLRLSTEADRAAELEKQLESLPDLTVAMVRADSSLGIADPASAGSAQGDFLRLEVIGHDHPGIVRALAETLASHQINVEELETELRSAPMTGEPMFQARARLKAPSEADLDIVQRDLERLAADLMVDIRFE